VAGVAGGAAPLFSLSGLHAVVTPGRGHGGLRDKAPMAAGEMGGGRGEAVGEKSLRGK
jgi:hypothetical protein